MSSFNFDIKHRRGIDNIIPDALSRAPLVLAIDTIDNPSVTISDKWYLNIFNGCQRSPTSFPNYRVENGILYRFMQTKCVLLQEFEWKRVIPLENRAGVLDRCHAQPNSGHLGIFKTYKRLSLNYYWPGMYSDTVKYVSKCDICLSYKHSTQGTLGKMGRPKCVSRPFHTISIDFSGPYPVSRKQNSYLLVIHCCFSKYTMLFPLRHSNAQSVAKILEENVFLIHGVPRTIILDNAKYFSGKTLDSLFKKYSIPDVQFTPVHCPQVNSVERYNRTIGTALASFIENDHRSWDTRLPEIQFAINSAVNETTGYTPNFILHGRELVSCGSLYPDKETNSELVFLPRDSYCENLGHLSKIFDDVQKALYFAHEKNATAYNTRRKQYEFSVGDIVFKRCYVLSDKDKYFSRKLAPKYAKCKIIHKRSPLVYELADMSGNKLGVWHIKDLKKIPAHT